MRIWLEAIHDKQNMNSKKETPFYTTYFFTLWLAMFLSHFITIDLLIFQYWAHLFIKLLLPDMKVYEFA